MCFSHTFRYSCRHSHFYIVHIILQSCFVLYRTLPYQSKDISLESEASAPCLAPTFLAQGRSTSELLRTLSRMAASEPTSWLSGHPHILVTLSMGFGTLAVGLGCFPFDYGSSHSQSHSQSRSAGILSLIKLGRQCCPLTYSVLYPLQSCRLRLHLNAFRGEPAITILD